MKKENIIFAAAVGFYIVAIFILGRHHFGYGTEYNINDKKCDVNDKCTDSKGLSTFEQEKHNSSDKDNGHKIDNSQDVGKKYNSSDEDDGFKIDNFNGVKIKWYLETSKKGLACWHVIKTNLAKGRIETTQPYIMAEANPAFEKNAKCKFKKYNFYQGNSVIFYNMYGGAQQPPYYCIQNKSTGKFIAAISEDFQYLLTREAIGDTFCERMESIAEIYESI